MPEYKVLPAGDTALVVEFGEQIDRQLSTWVLALARRLNEARLNGIVETVPTYRSLIVHYDPLAVSAAVLTARIVELMRGLQLTEGVERHWSAGVLRSRDRAGSRGRGRTHGSLAGAGGRVA